MAKSQIARCICDHDFQDQKYGKGLRVMNPTGKGDKSDIIRCTVCGREQRGRGSEVKEKTTKV